MSQKPPKKGVAVAHLTNPDKDGWLTKQGGSWKNWKRRWFVLKGDCLYYFKTVKDLEETGYIELTPQTTVKDEPKMEKKRKNCFSVFPHPHPRQYFMHPETPAETQAWINCITNAVERLKNPQGGGSTMLPQTISTPQPTSPIVKGSDGMLQVKSSSSPGLPRQKLQAAKDSISFLQNSDSKVLEFWQIWSESIPPKDDMQSGMAIDYSVSTSASMQKITWRTAGPQNIFIQRMVDFFWNVGAPESEIDRLNDVGALINPIKIGSWIDMSEKGGMDGGWFFPVDIPLKLALEAADPGEPPTKLKQWADRYSVDKCFSIGRDMGAAPPRQTEFRIKVPGRTVDEQLRIASDAYDIFQFPHIPSEAMTILRNSNPSYLCLSIITSSEGFVRLGLLTPKPSTDTVVKLCTLAAGPGAHSSLASLEGQIVAEGPAFVEYQYLKEGFGYGVYKEGFDIVFHYDLGEETYDEGF